MQNMFDLFHLIVFFAVYKTVDIYAATGALIASTAVHVGYEWFKTKQLPKKQFYLFLIVLVMGGMTIYFQDDAFIKWKVTVVNLIFAVGIFVSQAFFKVSPMQKMLGKEMKLTDQLWAKISYAWAAFFAAIAALNLYIAYNFSQDFWVNFKMFGLMGLTFVFGILTVLYIYPHLPKDEEKQEEKS
ncbi:septation protein A [Catenovulum maritimum]|uniref:Inner membrane-spanning protein YciB n=1 Tax=Catenovulum maritimum TaxID=1513271 RepID=A0A0J8GX13_9ALTE|nr:septation protein A [Catenovulum maritimum]KMT65243.1 intracellular septation protein A [Catenovulum maritimum]